MSDEIKFLSGEGDQSGDERLALMAACIVNQQHAGFKGTVDLRQATCHDCGAAGFNTGWGFYKFTCGAEVTSDGESCEPCAPNAVQAGENQGNTFPVGSGDRDGTA